MNLLILSLISFCSASNILLMFPLSPPSHVNAFVPMFKKLGERGHNLTMVVSFKPTTSIQNCTFIFVKNWIEDEIKPDMKKIFGAGIPQPTKFSHWPVTWKIFHSVTENFLKQKRLDVLIENDNSFDLMISETLYLQELFIAFGHIFNIPVISIDPHSPSVWSSYLMGNVNPYSFVPNFRNPVTDLMSFTERLSNTLMNLQEFYGFYYYFLPKQEALMRKYLSYGKYDFPPLIDMLKNTSLSLVDSHFSLGYVRPYIPNVVEVGGMTFNQPKGLDEEYQKYMDESTNGVILFTFGSIMQMKILPKDFVKQFMTAFEKLNLNVLMKYEEDVLPGKPDNVKISKWLPQNEILAHPNCRLFITHGGVHGLAEAVYHKVPMVTIPFWSDQHFNAKFAEQEGFGYILNNLNATSENILYAINTMLNNPEARTNIERRSLILRDKHSNLVDTGVYWVEYVIRHKGAKHLRPASLNLNFFQYFLIDVILLFITGFVIFCILLYIFVRNIFKFFRYILSSRKQKSE